MSQLYNVLTLLRLFAFMVVIYVGLGWLVERRSRNPESKLRAFFHILCAPVNKLVARRMAPGTTLERVFRVSFLAVVLVWVVLIVAHQLLRPET
jgi:uncharacterized protein YggT (Ycf19 family)